MLFYLSPCWPRQGYYIKESVGLLGILSERALDCRITDKISAHTFCYSVGRTPGIASVSDNLYSRYTIEPNGSRIVQIRSRNKKLNAFCMSVVRKQHSKDSIFISFPCNLIVITTESSINEEVWAMSSGRFQP